MNAHRFASIRRLSAAVLHGVAVAAVGGILISCPTGVDWSDYEGVNLIADRPLGATDADGASLWYFADGLEAGTTNGTTDTVAPVDFVTFESVDAAVYGTLPEGVETPVYRYEVRNLLPKGDFEAADDTDIGADPPGTALWIEEVPDGGTFTIDGSTRQLSGSGTLSIDTEDARERIYIDLDQHLIGGFPENVGFAFNLDFQSGAEVFGMVLENGTGSGGGSETNSWSIVRGEASDVTTFSFPGTFTDDPAGTGWVNIMQKDTSVSGATQLAIGGPRVPDPRIIEAWIDRFTIVRNDQSHYLRVSVPYRTAGRPEILAGGSYVVSLWVAPDPTAGDDNRIPARALSAGLDLSTNGDTGDRGAPVVTRVAATDHQRVDGISGWTELEFAVDSVVPALADDAPGDLIAFDVVIEIGNSYLGSEGRDAGSILIAAPRLEWRP